MTKRPINNDFFWDKKFESFEQSRAEQKSRNQDSGIGSIVCISESYAYFKNIEWF